MREIVIGYDGSAGADLAVDLVASTPWYERSVVVVTAVPDVREIRSAWGALALGNSHQIERDLAAAAEELLKPPALRLREKGRTCSTAVLAGRPASVIAGESASHRASLAVVGSRGLGPIRSTLLGSVSTEVIDLAPCPVLVARSASVTSIMLATDGSPGAEAAERALAALPVARAVPVTVVSVAESLRLWTAGIAPTMYQRALAAQARYEAEARRVHLEIAVETAARLRAGGVAATAEVASGDPASVLIDRSQATGADLIVLGTRGRTGLTRLLLGSVARRVLQHAGASVLVVRAATGIAPSGTAREPGST